MQSEQLPAPKTGGLNNGPEHGRFCGGPCVFASMANGLRVFSANYGIKGAFDRLSLGFLPQRLLGATDLEAIELEVLV